MENEIQQAQSGAVSREDVEGLYGLALGRPADKAAIDGFMAHDLPFLLTVFFEGPEFRDRVLTPLSERRPPDTDFYAGDVPEPVRRWARSRMPVSADAAVALEALDYWPAFYLTLFNDPVFQQVVGLSATRPFWPEAWEGLTYLVENASQFRRQAQIENIGWDWVEGWAMDRGAPDQPLRIEVWIDGRFVSAGQADLVRRELQDRFGGEGRAGFRLPVGDRLAAGGRFVEIRDAEFGRRLTAGEHAAPPSNPESYEALALELRNLRDALERIQTALPQVVTRLSYPLQDYARYAETYGRTTDAGLLAGNGRPRFLVRLHAEGAEAFEVEDAVMAILAQTYDDWTLEVRGLDEHGRQHLHSLRTRLAWTGRPVERIVAFDPEGPVAEFDLCLSLPAGGVLAPEALAVFAGVFADPEVAAAYADGDHLEPGGEATTAQRHTPLLRPAFDLDLLCQTPYVGDCIAFRGGDDAPLSLNAEVSAAAVLGLALEGRRIAHAPAILFSARQAAATDGGAWVERVGAALASDAAVSVTPADDLFGATVAGAARVKRRPISKTVSVIVPTRNALDLLKPCLDSVLAAAADNRTELDLIVIDHESDDRATQAYLAELSAGGQARIVRYEGRFNFALMNNLAVEQARGEVLVFLNNDTVVISRDWQDEMASQAERPDVACVGARLLYADGTIQHAGFVAREREANFLIHDGVGAASNDPGYLGRHALLHRTVAVTGACLAMETKKFKALGGFDAAHFPVEGNDVDLCMRAQSQGLKVLYDPYVALYHLESKTRGFSREGEKLKVAEASGRLLWSRWGQKFGADPFYNHRFDREARPFTRLRPLP
ncbi:glycosyltransferase family 2 protein [Brevundimonas sp.]|uniref:glycosyltransferase family 2 protein n=1 Tax=Brevundimonas sp. TaxID=1871086 RepID=UPI002EDB7CCE